MKIAMPMFGTRVSPFFLHADSMLIAEIQTGKIAQKELFLTKGFSEDEWIKHLEKLEVTTLVCGGIVTSLMDELQARGIEVINNVAAEAEDVLQQLQLGQLHSGYGINFRSGATALPNTTHQRPQTTVTVDCIQCPEQSCLKGKRCPRYPATECQSTANMPVAMEVATDIATEPERILCRVAELVYYCLGMEYKNLGVAFCTDLLSETQTLTSLLRRFFKVTPICCKIGCGAIKTLDSTEDVPSLCNPLALANVLNLAKTDINIIVGLCMGCDVTFTQYSIAPVTTLFVKDRLLANTPIAAIYSKYQEHLLNI